MLILIAWPGLNFGRVVVHDEFIPSDLTKALLRDCEDLHARGMFGADGIQQTAVGEEGFSSHRDRQTLRWHMQWSDDIGDLAIRERFAELMRGVRREAAATLRRKFPPRDDLHEMTYNWYEPGATLARHRDEYAKEGAATTRRSLSWLVYLNEPVGGELRCYYRESETVVGRCGRHLQVGWLDKKDPVFFDGSKLYGYEKDLATLDDVDLLEETRDKLRGDGLDFDLIQSHPDDTERDNDIVCDVAPRAGQLVLFDSVAVPHEVLPVGTRRHAVSGWFHETVPVKIQP